MEEHIIDIVRFATCLFSLVAAAVVMVRADDNIILRRAAAIIGIVAILFNRQIGEIVYLFISSIVEAIITVMVLGFVLLLSAVIMLLPVIAVIAWLLRRG